MKLQSGKKYRGKIKTEIIIRREMNQVSSNKDLTNRQRQIYEVLISYIAEYGFAPTVREMCKLTGLASTSSITLHLKTIEDKGYIKRYPSCPRAITILQ